MPAAQNEEPLTDRSEPQFVLGLSWLAITLTALDILSTSDVSAEQENGKRRDRQ